MKTILFKYFFPIFLPNKNHEPFKPFIVNLIENRDVSVFIREFEERIILNYSQNKMDNFIKKEIKKTTVYQKLFILKKYYLIFDLYSINQYQKMNKANLHRINNINFCCFTTPRPRINFYNVHNMFNRHYVL